MEQIIEPTMDYNFTNLSLGKPISQPSSIYLSHVFLNNSKLYIQTPKCITKNGFVKVGKKMYCDLMISHQDAVFINWIERLESACQDRIFNKRMEWFQTEMSKEDIETSFTSPLKIFKSGMYYILRVNVKPVIKIYNDMNTEINIDTVNEETNLISIIEVQGIKFTSRNFQIEFELKQSMVVSPDPFLDNCFIKKKTTQSALEITTPLPESCKNVEKQEEPLVLEISENHENDEYKELQKEESELSEFNLDISLEGLETIELKKPNEVYYQLYKETMERANVAKNEYNKLCLEARTIKEKYNLESDEENNIEDSDFDSFSDEDEDSENMDI
jgi:hypothetical protein